MATRVSSDEQVVLKDYKYLGVVDSNEAKQKLIDDVFHKEAITIRYGLDLGAIEFYTWKELREFNIEGNNELIAKVSDLITVGVTEALELTWLYQGVIYKSKAIVDSEDGIIFDNIASYALDYSAKIPRQEDHKYGRLSSTRSLYAMGLLDSMDSVGGDSVHTFVFELSDMADRIELTTGKPAWKYSIKVRSIFDDNGILIYRRCESKSEAALGWACEAAAETISGNLYSSPYHEFAWGWSYGSNNTTINISFAGNGFTITGGDHTERGTEIHSPIYYQ
ncbi:MAG: hypothetical protein IKY82_02215 [Alistipes sp.]|nr:hypothetical protein [Alistipes sp.]